MLGCCFIKLVPNESLNIVQNIQQCAKLFCVHLAISPMFSWKNRRCVGILNSYLTK